VDFIQHSPGASKSNSPRASLTEPRSPTAASESLASGADHRHFADNSQERKRGLPLVIAISLLVDLYRYFGERTEMTTITSSIESRGSFPYMMFAHLTQAQTTIWQNPPIRMVICGSYSPERAGRYQSSSKRSD